MNVSVVERASWLVAVDRGRRALAVAASASALAGCFHDFAFLDASRDAAHADAAHADAAIDAPPHDAFVLDAAPADEPAPPDAPPDAPPPPAILCSPDGVARCPACELGGAMGVDVAAGTTDNAPTNTVTTSICRDGAGPFEAAGIGTGPEATLHWTAPSYGVWRFDTAGSSFDTVVYVLGSGFSDCMGTQLACDDNTTDGTRQGCIAVTLAQGEAVVVVVDGFDASQHGAYTLSIYPGNDPSGRCR